MGNIAKNAVKAASKSVVSDVKSAERAFNIVKEISNDRNIQKFIRLICTSFGILLSVIGLYLLIIGMKN